MKTHMKGAHSIKEVRSASLALNFASSEGGKGFNPFDSGSVTSCAPRRSTRAEASGDPGRVELHAPATDVGRLIISLSGATLPDGKSRSPRRVFFNTFSSHAQCTRLVRAAVDNYGYPTASLFF